MRNKTINEQGQKNYSQPIVTIKVFPKKDIFMASNDVSNLQRNDSGNQVGWRETN